MEQRSFPAHHTAIFLEPRCLKHVHHFEFWRMIVLWIAYVHSAVCSSLSGKTTSSYLPRIEDILSQQRKALTIEEDLAMCNRIAFQPNGWENRVSIPFWEAIINAEVSDILCRLNNFKQRTVSVDYVYKCLVTCT